MAGTVCDLLHQCFNRYVYNVKLCSIDESLIGYQPSEEVKKRNENQGHPIPVSYIPRKPHSNGLLNYILTTTVEHPMNEKGLPYILDILPHLQQGDCSPHLALKKFLDRWCKTEKPHIFADSAFGSLTTMELVENWGGTATFSTPENNCSWLWKVLEYNLPGQHWRVAENQKKWVASCHAIIEDGVRSYQHILTNALTTTATATTTTTTTTSVPTSSEESIPVYTEDYLSGLKIKELREICSKYNVRPGKRKAITINNIVSRSQLFNQEFSRLEKLKKDVETCWKADPALIHDLYKSYFNSIDLLDRRWNSVEEAHQNHHWNCKMILTILRFTTINAWTWHSKTCPEKWEDWRRKVAQHMLKIGVFK